MDRFWLVCYLPQFSNDLQTRIDHAVKPKHNPVLIKDRNLDKDSLLMENETSLRMATLFTIGQFPFLSDLIQLYYNYENLGV